MCRWPRIVMVAAVEDKWQEELSEPKPLKRPYGIAANSRQNSAKRSTSERGRQVRSRNQREVEVLHLM